MPYTSIEKLLQKVTSQETLDNQSELVVLRLMNAINGRDYPHFYSLLEANNNKLLKFLVREMDDASILFWTNDNYTNFIGALVWMFNSDNCKSIINRLPNNAENYAQRVVNLKPITYEAPKATLWEISWSTKHNDGKYDNETGNIELRDIYTTYSLKTDPYGENHITELPHEVPIISLPPLTPIIIVPEDDRLPLIQTALSGGGLSNQMYIVPAIFLKYRFDKIRNDKIEKGVVTTLDVATIVLSGGTALATKVHWIRRAWALAEVVGAVGNIAVNTRAIRNPEVQKLVGIYNSAMALIGIKNAGVAGYKFVKELPEETKNLLRKSGELRHMLSERYKIWKGQKAKLGNSISTSEQQLLAQQEKAWGKLEIANDIVPNGVTTSLFKDSETLKDILKRVKIKQETPTLESFEKLFEQYHTKAMEYPNSVKPLPEVVKDFEYLIDTYWSSFTTANKEEQIVDFINELMQGPNKFKAGATTLEVIRHPEKYISAKYSRRLSDLELEGLISHAAGSGNFRFDAKWKIKNQDGKEIHIFVDTKNYSRASNMFGDLGQFKAYLENIDNFDQLYIIQQGGRKVTREQIIAQLEQAIAKDAKSVYTTNQKIWNKLGIKSVDELYEKCSTKKLSKSEQFQKFRNIIVITK